MLHVRAALTAEKASLDIKKVCWAIPDWLLHLDLLPAHKEEHKAQQQLCKAVLHRNTIYRGCLPS